MLKKYHISPLKKLKYFSRNSVKYLKQLTMSSTRIFTRPDSNEYDDNYYHKIEDTSYFITRPAFKNFGNFRVHGKYASTFHPERRIPNEYYCMTSAAMTLRSGKKLNYIQKTPFWHDTDEVTRSFGGKHTDRRCLSVKEMIWLWESYYHIISNCYELTKLYEVARFKIKEFISGLERSIPGIYQKINFEKKVDDNTGEEYYELDNNAPPMPRRNTDGKYVFCTCCYTVIKDGNMAIEQEGHHVDEFLPKLRKLDRMYSKPHRIIMDSDVFKFVNRKINDDCRRVVFSFLKSDDIQVASPAMPDPIPRPHRKIRARDLPLAK